MRYFMIIASFTLLACGQPPLEGVDNRAERHKATSAQTPTGYAPYIKCVDAVLANDATRPTYGDGKMFDALWATHPTMQGRLLMLFDDTGFWLFADLSGGQTALRYLFAGMSGSDKDGKREYRFSIPVDSNKDGTPELTYYFSYSYLGMAHNHNVAMSTTPEDGASYTSLKDRHERIETFQAEHIGDRSSAFTRLYLASRSAVLIPAKKYELAYVKHLRQTIYGSSNTTMPDKADYLAVLNAHRDPRRSNPVRDRSGAPCARCPAGDTAHRIGC